MNKKLVKLSLVLCASVLMAVSCAKKDESPTNPELPSIGTLTINPTTLAMANVSIGNAKGNEVTGAGLISGFNKDFESAIKDKDKDVKYTIKTITVASVSASGNKEAVQQAIKEGALVVQIGTKFNEIKVGFAATSGKTAAENAKDIAKAITQDKTATITLTVEAASSGNTAGKFKSSTFNVTITIPAVQ